MNPQVKTLRASVALLQRDREASVLGAVDLLEARDEVLALLRGGTSPAGLLSETSARAWSSEELEQLASEHSATVDAVLRNPDAFGVSLLDETSDG